MEDPINRFTNEFHNIQGVKLSDRKRNLFKLFNENKTLHRATLDDISRQLQPSTHLEQIYFTDFLIHFRIFPKLSELFLQGHDITVSKLSRERWFFQELFKTVRGDFVGRFPEFSYSLRMKILHKLSGNVTQIQADEIFDAVLTRYGISSAVILLTACGSDKIEAVLKQFPVKLKYKQLVEVYEKKPRLIYLYLEERVKNADLDNQNIVEYGNSFMRFLARKDLEMYSDLIQKYPRFQWRSLGKRNTKRFVRAKKDSVITDPEAYVDHLHSHKLVRNLGKDFKQVFVKIFPRDLHKIHSSFKLIHCYAKNGRFNLYKTTFDSIFHQKFQDFFPKMDYVGSFFDIFGPEQLTGLILDRYEKRGTVNDLIFCNPKFVLEKLSKKIQNSESVRIMTESCVKYKDYDSYVNLCKLLLDVKNNRGEIYQNFLNGISGYNSPNFFDGNVRDDVWNLTMEIVSRPLVESTGYLYDVFMVKYMQFMVENNKPVKEEMLKYLKGSEISRIFSYSMVNVKASVKKRLLEIALEIVPDLASPQKTTETIYCELFTVFLQYYPKEWHFQRPVKFEDFPQLVSSLKNALCDVTVDAASLSSAIGFVICTRNRTEAVKELTKLYFESSKVSPRKTVVMWFLRNRPQDIKNVIPRGDLFKYYWSIHICPEKKFWQAVKCYSHLSLDKKVIESIDLSLKNFEDLSPLSYLTSPEEYSKICETYLPIEGKFDFTQDGANDLYNFQRNYLFHLKNLKSPQVIFQVLLKFLRDDYVSSCLRALYSTACKTPENQVDLVLKQLRDRKAVSVQKHGYHVASLVLDSKTVEGLLDNFNLPQSIAVTFNYFRKNPTPTSWKILNDKLEKLSREDEVASRLLVNNPVAKGFKAVFAENLFTKMHEQNNKYKNVVLDKMKADTATQLNVKFFENVDFFDSPKLDVIFFNYLTTGKGFDCLSRFLRDFKEQNKDRRKLLAVVKKFQITYMEGYATDVALVGNLLMIFEEQFSPVDIFEVVLILELMKLKNLNTEDWCRNVLRINGEIVGKYGKLTVRILAERLKIAMKGREDLFEILVLLCRLKESVDDLVLIVYLLPTTEPVLENDVGKYQELIKNLWDVDVPVVRLHLNLYLKNLEQVENIY